jgi:hypothetical protein
MIFGVMITTFKPTRHESSGHEEELEKKVTLADSHHPIGAVQHASHQDTRCRALIATVPQNFQAEGNIFFTST